jgi:hypothetical protein
MEFQCWEFEPPTFLIQRLYIGWKHIMDTTVEKVDEYLWGLAQAEFGSTPANSQFWMPSDSYKTNAGQVQLHRCASYYQSGCPMRIKTVTGDDGDISMYKVDFKHKDHDINKFLTQASKQPIITAIQSPSHLKKGPKKLVGKAARKLQISISSDHQHNSTSDPET